MGDFMTDLIKYIKDNKLGKYKENVSFKTLTTYKTGGVCKLLFMPDSVDSLKMVLTYLKNNKISYKVFGNGSNILASDNDYNGVIIKLSSLDNIEIKKDVLEVEAGYNFSLLCNKMSKAGYKGFSFGCGIPGTVGGAVYMNAGAYLEDVSNIILKVDILDNNFSFKTLNKDDLGYSYRKSLFQEKEYIILKAYFKLEKGNASEIIDIIDDRKRRRIASQPLDYPSAGSVFRNPKDNYAGKLIEDVGLKGKMKGGAMISDKHANFVINKNNASSNDILYLMDLAKKEVKDKYDIDLYREQELFNFEDK